MSKYPLLKYIGEVYRPSEDSWLLVSLLSERKPSGNICLDLGSGSGIIGLYALLNGFCDRVVFVDIDEDAVKSTSLNAQLNDITYQGIIVQSDGVCVRGECFETVFANPPYLPAHDPVRIDTATEGGLEGYETILYFIDYAKISLKRNGLLYLVYSSLSKPDIVVNYLEKSGFKINIVKSKHFFFETIYVAECVRSW